MLPLLLELLESAGVPLLMLSIVLTGCCDDSRPKKDQKKKNKKGHSKKKGSHSKSHTSSSKKKKRGRKSSKSSKSKKSRSKSRKKRSASTATESGSGEGKKKHGSRSKSQSKSRTHSSKGHSHSKKGQANKRSMTGSASSSGGARRHFSRKVGKSKSIESDSKREQYQDFMDSRRISRPIGGEMPKEMMMEPAELHWSTTGGMQKVCINNPTDERKAIKVKCSDNNLYRVNPVFSFVEPGQGVSIDIVRQNGGAKIDKMVFVAAPAKVDDDKPRELFTPGVANPMMVLPLIAA